MYKKPQGGHNFFRIICKHQNCGYQSAVVGPLLWAKTFFEVELDFFSLPSILGGIIIYKKKLIRT